MRTGVAGEGRGGEVSAQNRTVRWELLFQLSILVYGIGWL